MERDEATDAAPETVKSEPRVATAAPAKPN